MQAHHNLNSWVQPLIHSTCKLFRGLPFTLLIVPYNSIYYNYLIITQWLVGCLVQRSRQKGGLHRLKNALLNCHIYTTGQLNPPPTPDPYSPPTTPQSPCKLHLYVIKHTLHFLTSLCCSCKCHNWNQVVKQPSSHQLHSIHWDSWFSQSARPKCHNAGFL